MREKEKLLVTSNFYFSHIVFYPFGELSAISIKFQINGRQDLYSAESFKIESVVTLIIEIFFSKFESNTASDM